MKNVLRLQITDPLGSTQQQILLLLIKQDFSSQLKSRPLSDHVTTCLRRCSLGAPCRHVRADLLPCTMALRGGVNAAAPPAEGHTLLSSIKCSCFHGNVFWMLSFQSCLAAVRKL